MSVQKSKKAGPAKKVADKPAGKVAAAPPRKRGRPRAFEPEAALRNALDTFRETGFAATSLDDLSTAMGINRPSLYNTFGDKRELFLRAYQQYRQETGALFAPALDPKLTLRQMLEMVFATAINLYLSGENGPRGCFTVMTAASEAMSDPEIRALVQKAIAGADRNLAERFRLAVKSGELSATADCAALAQAASATIQSIALRARAHVPRTELEEMARNAIELIAGPARR